jgi:arginine-tRNA-protein transferase
VDRIVSFKTPPSRCEYLHDRESQLQYELLPHLQPSDYMQRLKEGWRRIGPVIFRPDCEGCRECLTLRIPVSTFRPSESQRRALKRNARDVQLTIGTPVITLERVALYTRFHEHGHETKGWPAPEPEESALGLHVLNPFPTEEWSYWIHDRLVGVGYVDALPEGLSAIYFFHDPAQHRRSLGTFHILKVMEAVQQRQLPHLYLGYYVGGCRSLEYKARFRPCEVLTENGWAPLMTDPRL